MKMMGLLQTAVYRFVTYLSCLLYLFYFVPFLLFWALPLLGWIYVTVANFMGFFYIAKVVEYHASENFMSWTSILPTLTFSSALYYIGKADDAGLAVSLSGATGICKAPMPCCRVMIFLAVEWAIFLLLGIYIDVAVTSQGYQKYALIFLDCPMYMRTIKRYFWCKLEILKHLCFSRSCDIRMETGMDFSLYTLDMELQSLVILFH
ncbi:ABC transporter, family A isoform 1 [Galdieria sulphuraria]|uniref:ABC transporter, family A isoform 1 n=1 Tax=Galdieria sulphuraria TaxID=130081 RepID=M2W3M8_GALSU|nr:ABC transporter, family A isoform 1 [Galdieria sulphuraria]EME30316.1 ABC transporter, family A isoform 1 [Galdieria sulphuraria]|eukprot:XP_005706836.1 ABC transporter, family A isoform 1 [Galdieria sulphuraria]